MIILYRLNLLKRSFYVMTLYYVVSQKILGMNLGVLFIYSLYSGYFPAEISSLTLALPWKRSISKRLPIELQLMNLPVAATLKT